jgi:hypothetical protein
VSQILSVSLKSHPGDYTIGFDKSLTHSHERQTVVVVDPYHDNVEVLPRPATRDGGHMDLTHPKRPSRLGASLTGFLAWLQHFEYLSSPSLDAPVNESGQSAVAVLLRCV